MQANKTQPFIPAPRSPEDLLESGLPNLWYLIARSEDVTDRPVALKRLDRNIVLWRGTNGEINIVEDYCPHRGAPLSMGEVVNGNIACAYHGVQLTGGGVVAEVPPTPSCPLVGQKAIKSYPTRELAGGIWAYFGDAAHGAVPEPIFPEEITDDAYTSFLFTATWQCNWQVALDNRTDPVHGSFLHAGTFTLGRGRKDTELKIVATKDGFETSRDNQRGVNIDWHEVFFVPGNSFWVRTEIPYPAAIGGGSFRIVGLPTPIDRDSTYFWVYRSRKISGFDRDLWRFLYKNRLEARSNFVVEQDRVMLEAIPLEARQREKLLQVDVAIARLRRMLRTEATRLFDAAKQPEAAE
jgi:phenylpropionate dioxygenase-like ring-hydroxylating dioxygenase large terminal subunit